MPYSPILAGQRPSAPSTWKRSNITSADAHSRGLAPTTTNMIAYPLTWHHNIPWQVLRDSWNIIFTFCSPQRLQSAFRLYSAGANNEDLLNKLMEIQRVMAPTATNISGATYEKWVARLSDGPESLLLSTLATTKQLTADDSDRLASVVAWSKWNIVEGPKESVRTDDPGSDAFDDFSTTVAANADQTLFQRFEKASLYFEALTKIVADYEQNKTKFGDKKKVDEWDTQLSTVLATTAQYLTSQPLVMFSMGYWQTVKNQGQLRKKTIEGLELYLTAKSRPAS